jgi:hypothetical protein
MSIPEPKVEHHEGRGIRSCPIFPELRPYLDQACTAWQESSDKSDYVINKPVYREAADTGEGWKNSNLRTQLVKTLRKAGIPPWKRLFHSMRASRQTELERDFPIHVVCSWLGNTEAIAKKSYLLVTDTDFEQAIAAKKSDAESDALDSKSDAASDRSEQHQPEENVVNPSGKRKKPAKTLALGAEGTGLEPATPYGAHHFQ